MNYYMLASGSKGNACIIEVGQTRLLIDCGTTKSYLMQSFASLNLSFEDIDAVLVTHDHSDHTSQLKHFTGTSVYCPTPNAYRSTHVEAYQRFTVGDASIFPIKTSHDAEHSVGYVIDGDGSKLVYVTDTGYIRESDLSYLVDADYYILESNHDPEMLMQTQRPYYIKQRILSDEGHLSNDEAGTILARVVSPRTKEVVLAHLSDQANTESLALETVRSYLSKVQLALKVAKARAIVAGGSRESA